MSGTKTSCAIFRLSLESFSFGLAVPTDMPTYTCRESAETTAPLFARAQSMAQAVLPEAVGPKTTCNLAPSIVLTLNF